MLFSMTGFGRAVIEVSLGKLVIEIQSVNRKFLDISIILPKEFSRFEYSVRQWVGERIVRGQITLRITLLQSADTYEQLLPDTKVLSVLKKKWEQIACTIGYDRQAIDLSFLLSFSPMQQTVQSANSQDAESLQSCLQDALDQLIQMRSIEGSVLSKDLQKRLLHVQKYVQSIELLASNATQKMKKKLVDTLKEVQGGLDLDDRILREVVIYAERVDIAEEITRLRSHLNQFTSLLQANERSVGRKLEFLLQEMNRETNTIGSKSAEIQISHLVIEIKTELEQMREQIQNIE